MSAPSTSGLSVGLLLRVIDVKYGCLLYLLYFNTCEETATSYEKYVFFSTRFASSLPQVSPA